MQMDIEYELRSKIMINLMCVGQRSIFYSIVYNTKICYLDYGCMDFFTFKNQWMMI